VEGNLLKINFLVFHHLFLITDELTKLFNIYFLSENWFLFENNGFKHLFLMQNKKFNRLQYEIGLMKIMCYSFLNKIPFKIFN